MATIFDLQQDFEIDLVKSDAEQGIITACASSEATDRQGDQIPYELMKATMKKFASVIGIRLMHQPKAIGRLIKWWGDDREKKIYVQIQLSKARDGQDALTMVKEGILKGLSIGGKALSWAYEGSKRVIKAMTLSEISLVDVPANQDATISLVKRLDSDVNKEVRAFLSEWEPALLKDWDESQHPRGPDGKFGSGGGASGVPYGGDKGFAYGGDMAGHLAGRQATAHSPAAFVDIGTAKELVNELHEKNGFTISGIGEPVPTSGYTLSERPDAGVSVDPAEFDAWSIRDFVQSNVTDLSAPGNYVGGYMNPDTGKVDLDISTSVQDLSEALARATAANQTSIWDVVGQKEIFTGIKKLQKAVDPEADLRRRGQTVGIARKDGEPMTPPKGYPTDWTQYADPANWSWPCDESRCTVAVGRYNQGAGKDKYTPREWATLGRRIARIASKTTGNKYTYKAGDKSIESKETKMSKAAEDFLKDWDPGQLGKIKNPAVPAEASGLAVDKCNDQGGKTLPVLSKKASDFLKEWDPEYLEDITKVVSAEEIATAVSSKGKE